MARTISRRTFLRAAVDGGDESALVVVFLRGGADTLNMIVPYGDDRYYAARPSLAIAPPGAAATAAIRLDDFYAFHPAMRPLVPAWREGRLGALQAVGSDDASGSHFEAQDLVERGESAASRASGGWIGRYLRAEAGQAARPLTAVAIGEVVPESLRGAAGASVIRSIDDVRLDAPSGEARRVSRALEALYGAPCGALGAPGREALDLLSRVEALRSAPYAPAAGAAYGEDAFSGALREVARLVKARVGLRVACVDLDGWDTHFVQGAAEGLQASVIGQLATGLAAFDADLAGERVTTLVMTEFGRRSYENSSGGTDHGRGFAMLALGARVRGGRVHGAWPGLEVEEGPLGPGGLKIAVDYRSALAGAIGRARAASVFRGFEPEPVGLFA
jgi:uncharacterized protein (DUF1501 family)